MKNNFYTSIKIKNPNITYGFFTRENGFSKKNFSSLNCSYNSGDVRKNVHLNILESQKKLSLNTMKIKIIEQIHSNKVVVINKRNFANKFQADGMITQDKKINIAILTADCCPIFLFDKDSSFIACLHAGWKGTYYNIIQKAVIKIKKIQPNLKKVNAIIGPCLHKKNFEVSNSLKNRFIKLHPIYKKYFEEINNKRFFDMRGLLKFQLIQNHITKIENIDFDTYANKKMFFSHRRSTHNNNLPTGRMINIIGFTK